MDGPPKKSVQLKHLRATDAAAVAKLATQATLCIAGVAEGVHQSVLQTLGAAAAKTSGKGSKGPGQTGGITGLVYSAVRGVTHLVGKGLDTALTQLKPLFEATDHSAPESPQREAVLAALNGVLGDHLAATQNPLATTMQLRHSVESPKTGKILLLIHGLCMNDLQWRTSTKLAPENAAAGATQTLDHGAALAAALGYSPVYLRYNSGLHVSQNGQTLSRQLAQLLQDWPVPVTELSVVAHSMGGLVIRSAVHYATDDKSAWLASLKNIAFLGTPHHGAPLERAGNWIDVLLGSTPYSRPFAILAQLRSAGITDLRYGHVLDTDWQGHDRFRQRPDSRLLVPLPAGVASCTIAATLAGQRSSVSDRLLGDGLVPLESALGQHVEPHRSLAFDNKAQRILYKTSHLALLKSPLVTQQLIAWFSAKL